MAGGPRTCTLQLPPRCPPNSPRAAHPRYRRTRNIFVKMTHLHVHVVLNCIDVGETDLGRVWPAYKYSTRLTLSLCVPTRRRIQCEPCSDTAADHDQARVPGHHAPLPAQARHCLHPHPQAGENYSRGPRHSKVRVPAYTMVGNHA